MAMNFKVFENKDQVAEYSADIIRKQFNNNPTNCWISFKQRGITST